VPSVLDSPDVRDWDRQRDEPPDAFFAFKRWRDTNCTFVALAEDVDRSPSTIAKWAQDWSWKVRKLAFDRYVTSGDAEAAKVTSETLAATHLTALAQARDLALRAIARLRDELAVNPKAVSASAAARLLAEAVRGERLTLGQATEISEGVDYSKLTDAEFDEIVRLQRKAQGT